MRGPSAIGGAKSLPVSPYIGITMFYIVVHHNDSLPMPRPSDLTAHKNEQTGGMRKNI